MPEPQQPAPPAKPPAPEPGKSPTPPSAAAKPQQAPASPAPAKPQTPTAASAKPQMPPASAKLPLPAPAPPGKTPAAPAPQPPAPAPSPGPAAAVPAQREDDIPLTDRQQAFVREYLIDLNATAAYKRAGYSAKGNAAEAAASRLLRNVKVEAAIQAGLGQAEKRSAATLERIELELERIALADVRKLFRDDGTLRSPDEWDADTAAAVSSLEITEEVTGSGKSKRATGTLKKVRCWEKVKAIVDLLNRRDRAGKGPLGSKDNPIHTNQRITFVEFADAEPASVPPADGSG